MPEQITLTIESCQPAKRKNGTTVEGIGKNGIHWQLFKINQKYSYFHHGEKKIDFILGKEYPFDLETKQEGEFTNYQITCPKKGTSEEPLKELDQGEIIIGKLNKLHDILVIMDKKISRLLGE